MSQEKTDSQMQIIKHLFNLPLQSFIHFETV